MNTMLHIKLDLKMVVFQDKKLEIIVKNGIVILYTKR